MSTAADRRKRTNADGGLWSTAQDQATWIGAHVDPATRFREMHGPIEGSDVDIGGDAEISATDILVLDGKDERRTVTTVETTTSRAAKLVMMPMSIRQSNPSGAKTGSTNRPTRPATECSRA